MAPPHAPLLLFVALLLASPLPRPATADVGGGPIVQTIYYYSPPPPSAPPGTAGGGSSSAAAAAAPPPPCSCQNPAPPCNCQKPAPPTGASTSNNGAPPGRQSAFLSGAGRTHAQGAGLRLPPLLGAVAVAAVLAWR